MLDHDFFKSTFNQWLIVGLVLIGVITLISQVDVPYEKGEGVHFFFSPTCPHCAAQKEFNKELMQEFPSVNFIYHDISTSSGAEAFVQMSEELKVQPAGMVPLTIIGNEYFVGYADNDAYKEKLRNALEGYLIAPEGEPVPEEKTDESRFVLDLPFLGVVDVREFSLPFLAATLGLIDGFNPCAMWVLVYLISIVMSLQDRRRLWLIVGSFVFASGALYFLFMTAWLNAFLFIGYFRPLTILIGLVALGGGILSVKEYIETKGALECKVTDAGDKKKTMDKIKELVASPLSIGTVLGIIALAFVVNSIEFACSSAIPAVFTQVLALSNLAWWEHYLYILLYDFFFMLDDLVIFSLAAFAVSSNIGDKYAKYCKLFGGAIMLFLGIALVFAPGLLS